MIQTPIDLLDHHSHIRLRLSDMCAIFIDKKRPFRCDDTLQTAHCLEMILTGTIDVRYAGYAQHLVAGDIQFRRRGNYQLFPSDDYTSLLIFMENEFVDYFLDSHVPEFKREKLSADLPPFTFKTTEFIKANITQVIQQILHPQNYSRCIVKFASHQVLLQILSGDQSKTFVSFLKDLVSQKKIDLAYFMETNFNRQLSIPDMAKLTGRSVSAFKKEFTDRFNTTPIKWQINRRLEYAEYQLKHSNDPVSLVAYSSGFENISHFSKIYKQKFGASPKSARSEPVL
ncbi:helix-turn-helix transcriptional regulator [Mucilaginibacter sp. FT3.2]|uniref:helix-turn-helix transcriptional regulator n=1 Tax=Mucilaginibacter sp. FT3.2 TaxID=2723090 RepID=UPI00161A4343|nr:AraC family transcriptional regulator [Mucilaginibacter sp. FT3.2]MBB6231717.1 AraC-like DNA-binding protein [Mucilaginibacter sp. FT3.2]